MFPLRLLALLFISTSRVHLKETERKRKEEEEEDGGRGRGGREDNKYDLIFSRGDLLEVPRTLFTHFGIYLGAGRVAHFIPDIMPVVSSDECRIKQMVTNTRLLLGVLAKCGSIRVDSVDDFAYGSEILINTKDKVCSRPALRGEEVARRAEKLQGDVSYSLLWYNCEHFVMYCRYGTVMSFQTFQVTPTPNQNQNHDQTSAGLYTLLGACLLLYLGAVNTCSGLLAVLLPFLIWMAS
uniref:Lecithin retinol acyltransferase-like n=1 Tax=Echeneis naucrates TaxID=173247 RepID=A0A665U4H8_ECHNA